MSGGSAVYAPMHGRSVRGFPQAATSASLMLVVALAVVPLGSNRPFLWAFWPLVLGLLSFACTAFHLLMRRPFPLPLASIRTLVALYAVFCVVLLLQLAPLGSLYWGALLAPAGITLHPPAISTTPGETLLMLLRWVGYGLMFFLALQVAGSPRRRLWLLQMLGIIVTLHAVLALLSFHQWGNTILGVERWAYPDSITGTFVNRNSFASFLAIGLTITTTLLLRSLVTASGTERLTGAATYCLCLVFQASALLGTNSRMGLLVGVLGPAVVLVCQVGRVRRQGLWTLVMVAAVVTGAAWLYGSGVWTRFLELERSGQVRLELYQQIWDMILKAPWLGFGGGSFEQAYPLFHRPPVFNELVWDRAHNTYLALWVELGLVAGSLPLLMLLGITGMVAIAWWKTDRRDPAAPIWLGTMTIAAVHSLVDFSFEMFAIALLFSALAGIAVAAALTGGLRQSLRRGTS
jgi:O-antigen ligase